MIGRRDDRGLIEGVAEFLSLLSEPDTAWLAVLTSMGHGYAWRTPVIVPMYGEPQPLATGEFVRGTANSSPLRRPHDRC